MKLLGHILRTEKDDLMHQVTFNSQGVIHHLNKKRIGQPRKKWLHETMQHAYNTYVRPYIENDEDREYEFDPYFKQHMEWLKEVADERLF